MRALGPIPSPRAAGPFEQEVARCLARDRRNGLPPGEPGDPFDALPDLAPDPDIDEPSGPSGRTLLAMARSDSARMQRPPLTIAAALLFARALDGAPDVIGELRTGSARIVLDVPDPLMLTTLRSIWPVALFGDGAVVEPITQGLQLHDAARARALSLVVTTAPKARERDEVGAFFLRLLQAARPMIALSPDAASCLPAPVLRAAHQRLTLPSIDTTILATTIRIVTGRAPRPRDLARVADLDLTPADLAIAVRADRTPGECFAELTRISAQDTIRSGIGRDLALSDVHGARDAVAWARGMLAELSAWRAGGSWANVPSGLLLVGPPGCGKTLLAAVIAQEAGMALVTGSLARWQSADQAHLGTTLRAMRAAFEEARTKAMSGPGGRRGAVLLIDECDSFPRRDAIRHDHRDYVVEVVNSMLELSDGAQTREGVILIGTTNNADRIEPALLRPGRLGHTIEIGYPDLDERVSMLRVRLGAELLGADLIPVAKRTERATGAAMELLVNDARRRARAAGRPLALADLMAVVGAGEAEISPALLRRMAIHEAGHGLIAARTLGTAGMTMALQNRDGAGGWVDLAGLERTAGTRAEVEGLIRVLLAGRAAETVALGEPSAGARSDLAEATRLVARLLGPWGLGDRLVAIGRDEPAVLLADPEMRREAAAILSRLHEEACRMLEHECGTLLRLSERLIEERRLDEAEVAAIVGPPIGPRALPDMVRLPAARSLDGAQPELFPAIGGRT